MIGCNNVTSCGLFCLTEFLKIYIYIFFVSTTGKLEEALIVMTSSTTVACTVTHKCNNLLCCLRTFNKFF